ncbi:hypothetical protein ACSBR1_007221 [Camellia fascicularis]
MYIFRRVLLFPKGNNTNHLSIYLDVPDPAVLPSGWSRYAQFSFALLDQIHSHNTVKKETQHEFNSRESHISLTFSIFLSKFLPKSSNQNEIHDPSKGFLVNDTTVVEADFTGQSHDLKKETGHVEVKKQEIERRNEESSQNPSQDNDSGNVEADITAISEGEVSPLEPIRQDVAPHVDKEANRPPGLS